MMQSATPAGDDVGVAIEVVDLVKRYGDVTALDGMNLTVQRGEVLGVLGPNGAGKTTLINVLSTLERPDSGRATVAGYDVVADAHRVRCSIALTGQFAAVDGILTGQENLVLFGRLRGLDRRAAEKRAIEMLERFSLQDAAGKPAGGYSGGMRRRLDLAASLIVPTQVIFLDEPTTGLDPRSRNELWDVVRELRRAGLTIVLTTQYLEEADQLAERIVVIDSGRVIASDTPTALKAAAGGSSCLAVPVDPAQTGTLTTALSGMGATVSDDGTGVVIPAASSGDLPNVVLAARDAGVDLADIRVRTPTLDEVFLQLTHRPGAQVPGGMEAPA